MASGYVLPIELSQLSRGHSPDQRIGHTVNPPVVMPQDRRPVESCALTSRFWRFAIRLFRSFHAATDQDTSAY